MTYGEDVHEISAEIRSHHSEYGEVHFHGTPDNPSYAMFLPYEKTGNGTVPDPENAVFYALKRRGSQIEVNTVEQETVDEDALRELMPGNDDVII